jgi:hypothetical protein
MSPQPTPPRRVRMDQMVRAERAILKASDAVEAMPPDLDLTDAVTLLSQARAKVAAFVDRQPPCQHAHGFYQLEAETYCRACHQIQP